MHRLSITKPVVDEEGKGKIQKNPKEIKRLESITTVLKLIIGSFSLTTFNCNPTDEVTIGMIWFFFFFLHKNFWNVVKTKLTSIVDTQNPLNLNMKNITKNTKTQSKNIDCSKLLTILKNWCKSVLVIAFHTFLWMFSGLDYKYRHPTLWLANWSNCLAKCWFSKLS